MRVVQVVLSFLFILVCSPRLNSQQTTSAPPRDAQAIPVIQNALAALRGSAIGQIQTCVAQGTMQAIEGSWLTSGDFTWESSGRQFRYDNPAAGGRSILVSGKSRPVVTVAGKSSKLFAHITDTSFPPHLAGLVLLQRFQNPNSSFQFGNETLAGRPVIHIRSTLLEDAYSAAISTQDWYFDASSFLPLRIEYRLPASGNALLTIPATVDLADYRNMSGILMPFQISFSADGQLGGVAKLSSIKLNVSINPADFDGPLGGTL